MKKPLQYKFNIFLFLLPALFLFIAVLIAPIIMSFYYSLTEWNGFTTPEFIGVKNYIELFTSRSINIPRALKNAFLLALLSCVIQLPFALWLALRLARPIKGKTALLSIYFMPVLISTTCCSAHLVWTNGHKSGWAIRRLRWGLPSSLSCGNMWATTCC